MNKMLIRLREVFKDSGESQTSIANKLDVTSAYIWKILNKDNVSPRKLFIDAVCKEFNINEVWLRTGEGEKRNVQFDNYTKISVEIAKNDEKARQAIIDYWNLSEDDKKLFWNFLDRFVKKNGGD